MKAYTIAHISRDNKLNFSFEGIRWLALLENYLGQTITHARYAGESVFKLMNERVHPDGYAVLPARGNKPINPLMPTVSI